MPSVERHWLSEAEGFILLNYDTGRILPTESKIKVTFPLVPVTDSLVIDYDSADESSICSTPLPLLEKLAGVELDFGPKSIKSILKSNSTFKAETLKGVTINEPNSAPAKANKNVSASKRNSAPVGKLKMTFLCQFTPLPLLEKLAGVELVSGPKTIKSILKSNSTFKAETLKGVTINEPTSAPAKANKNVSASKRNSAPVGLFGPVTPRSINHENYTLVIVDEYSRVAKDLWERVQLQMHGTSLIKQEREYSCFAVPVFSSGDDPIACLNKAMAFLTVVASSRFPTTIINQKLPIIQETKPTITRCQVIHANKFRRDKGKIILEFQQVKLDGFTHNAAFLDSGSRYLCILTVDDLSTAQAVLMANISNYGFDVISEVPNSETYLNDMDNIQDGMVTVQQVQGRQGKNYSGHMARQCTQPKRPRNAAWYKEKAMLVEAQEAGQILDEEQLAFLADPGIPAGLTMLI
ncbi:hypothetical protein Tco_0339400 [Tanacetum coccineum]